MFSVTFFGALDVTLYVALYVALVLPDGFKDAFFRCFERHKTIRKSLAIARHYGYSCPQAPACRNGKPDSRNFERMFAYHRLINVIHG